MATSTNEVHERGSRLSRAPGVAVVASNVDKTYVSRRGRVAALSGVELSVSPGEFVSLLGPSGCGKSTLLSVLAGLERPTGGDVSVDGRRVTRPVVDAGFMFQRDLLLDWRTCERNVLLQFEMRGLDARPHRARANELLEMVGLAAFAQKHPYELSGGMRQRVALCRALIHEPPLLFMDEPFGALDALTREVLNAELYRITRELRTTVLLVTHSIDEAVFLSDRVVVMTPRPGRIEADVRVDLPTAREESVRALPEFSSMALVLRKILDGQHGRAEGSSSV